MDTNRIECSSCAGQGRHDVSGPGPSYFGARHGWLTCETCAGEGTVTWCPGCESVCRGRDAESVERVGQCEGCVAYDAERICGGCRQPATRRDAFDVADVCDFCGEASDTAKQERERHEKRLAEHEWI